MAQQLHIPMDSGGDLSGLHTPNHTIVLNHEDINNEILTQKSEFTFHWFSNLYFSHMFLINILIFGSIFSVFSLYLIFKIINNSAEKKKSKRLNEINKRIIAYGD